MRHSQYPAGLPDFAALPEAERRRFVIRLLARSDEAEMAGLFKRLELQARLDRFGHEIGDAALEAYAQQSLATSPAVFGALIDAKLAGVAEITRFSAEHSAVLAFAVDAERRRQGRLPASAGNACLDRRTWTVQRAAAVCADELGGAADRTKGKCAHQPDGRTIPGAVRPEQPGRIFDRKSMMESCVSELSAAESAYLLVVICLLLASLLVWACHDAAQEPPPSYIRNLLLRSRARYRKS